MSAGADLDELLRLLVPRGFFVPVTPGTRFVTIGGAIASDIHGKNHHVEGSFGNHVHRMSLQLADGSIAELSPQHDPELFWATIGGMGLTGVVLDATIGLLPVETSRMAVDTHRLPDLDTLMATMADGDDDSHRYSVAWIDLSAKGRQLGRSVLTRGDHARLGGGHHAAAPEGTELDGGTQRLGECSCCRVGVDVVRLPLAVGADGGDHRNEPVVDETAQDHRVDRRDVAHEAELGITGDRADQPGVGTHGLLRQLHRGGEVRCRSLAQRSSTLRTG